MTPARNITIATCAMQPSLTESDAIFARALERRGASVTAAPWNGDQAPFAAADAVIIRSPWDYFHHTNAFEGWLEELGQYKRVFNDPALMRWNMHKSYLTDLQAKGVTMAGLRQCAPEPDAILAAIEDLGGGRMVIKPVVSGGALGLSVVDGPDAGAVAQAAEALKACVGDALVQKFMPEISTIGETSLIFFGGAFSHAVVKRPKSGDVRCQAEHGGQTERVHPSNAIVAKCQKLLEFAPSPPLYARVDAIILDETPWLMELECIEPELFFNYAPEAADRLADLLVKKILD